MILLNEKSVIKADFSSSSGLHKSSESTDAQTTQSEADETAQIDTEAFDLLKSD